MTGGQQPMLGLSRAVGRFLAIVSGWWLLFLALLTCIEIVARKLAGFTFQGIDEISGYSLAITAAFGFTWSLVSRSHTRVDLLLSRLPQGARAAMNAGTYLCLAGVALLVVWTGADVLRQSVELQSRSTTPLQTPMWIPHGLWLLGIAIFAVAAVAAAVHALMLLWRDRKALNSLYGPLSVEEEIALEAGDLEERRP